MHNIQVELSLPPPFRTVQSCFPYELKQNSAGALNEGEEALLEDVEDRGKEESKSQEDEQLVCQLPPVVLQDQLPT